MSSCPLCGNEPARTLRELPVSITSHSLTLPSPSRLQLCERCGHLFTDSDVDWQAYYQQHYDALLTDEGFDELVATPDGRQVFRTEFDYGLLRRMLGDSLHAAARVLEFGCGRGRILSRLVHDGFRRVWACDVSERYREGAARLVGASQVSIGEVPPGPFDVITSFFVLEHDAMPVQTLAVLRERLSASGTLFLMVPHFRSNLIDLACADHLQHFTFESLRGALGAAGFSVTSVDVSTPGTLAVTATVAPRTARLDNPNLVKDNFKAAQPLLRKLDRLAQLPRELEPHGRVFLYGAGFHGALARAHLPHIAGVFDGNPRKQGSERLGHTVASPAEIHRSRHRDACLLVCVNGAIAASIADQYKDAFGAILTL